MKFYDWGSSRTLVATPVTPFTASGDFDAVTYRRLLQFLISHGADAVATPMHIGESLKLTSAERKELIEVAREVTPTDIPLLAHVSLGGTGEVIELAQHAISIGASGIVVLPPYHWRPSPPALVDHFAAIAKAVETSPVVLYNYPDRMGVDIGIEVLAELFGACENIVGLKDASLRSDYHVDVCRLAHEHGREFSLYSGVEYALPTVVVGGTGCFSACGGIAPRTVAQFADAIRNRDFVSARPLQWQLGRLFKILEQGYPATIKAAMEFMGRPCGPSRKPAEPFSSEQSEILRRRLAECSFMEHEPVGW